MKNKLRKELNIDSKDTVDNRIVRAVGYNAAKLLIYLIQQEYYFDKNNELTPDRRFWKLSKSINSELKMDDNSRRRAQRLLKDRNWIKVKRKGYHAVNYYFIMFEEISKYIDLLQSKVTGLNDTLVQSKVTDVEDLKDYSVQSKVTELKDFKDYSVQSKVTEGKEVLERGDVLEPNLEPKELVSTKNEEQEHKPDTFAKNAQVSTISKNEIVDNADDEYKKLFGNLFTQPVADNEVGKEVMESPAPKLNKLGKDCSYIELYSLGISAADFASHKYDNTLL